MLLLLESREKVLQGREGSFSEAKVPQAMNHNYLAIAQSIQPRITSWTNHPALVAQLLTLVKIGHSGVVGSVR